MIKKIYKKGLIVLILGYSILIGYQYYSNSKSFNDFTNLSNSLMNSYKSTSDKVKFLEKNLNDINTEKDSLSSTIKEAENNLKELNDKVALKTKQVIGSGKGSKVAYLTFDDGPSPYTNRVLNILKEYNIKATFFVNGRADATSLSVYRRIVNEGHSIGNHTYTHKFQNIYTSVQAFDNDFNNLQDLILNTTGVTMDIMRFPGGSNNAISNSYSVGAMNMLTTKYKSMGYTYFDWNVSAGDSWEDATASYVIDRITSQCRYKTFAIILMHDSRSTTPDALESVIQTLTSYGFKFMPLSSSTPVIQFK
jgi:peptidoglycan/xylan/chitin deacetylase (PgdA/CDA1 family)